MKKQLLMGAWFLGATCFAQTYHQLNFTQGPELVSTTTSSYSICPGNSVALAIVTTGGASPYNYVWTPGDSLSSTTTDTSTANPSTTTTYAIEVSDSNNCTNNLSITVNVLDCSSLEEVNSLNSMNLYPNPTNGEFNVETYTSVGPLMMNAGREGIDWGD